MLGDTQFDPIFAENGQEAVTMFKAEPERFSAILMDVSMPCLLYTSPSPRDLSTSRMPSSA